MSWQLGSLQAGTRFRPALRHPLYEGEFLVTSEECKGYCDSPRCNVRGHSQRVVNLKTGEILCIDVDTLVVLY